ncbi:prephenate dehydratase [Salibacterium salarium]|uniref:Prephenate dehydratase n=1 Tax=Salibacterium salarium TaxID=284579 RepID=A0A428MTN3_9BACI|nr:prephenate dehydratase [Salibacterium salarium]RSL29502.1 prephenate dehydratase [Salibacterium salarium]
MTKKIGYLGPVGSFTEVAAKSVLPDGVRHSFSTIPACMSAAAEEEIDIAVVPLENAIEGSVNMTLDYLIHKHQLPIIGEVTVPIEQHLLVHPDRADDWNEITDIYSHPQAIAQCHEFIQNQFPAAVIHYTNSTSSAAQDIADNPEKNGAAIANSLAAKAYGLTTVKENIHDYDNNHTRFALLSHTQETLAFEENEKNKTTMVITLPSDFSGALHQVLSAFAWRKLNLTKIESRPMKTGIGNYFFVIDVEQEIDDVLLPGVIAEVEALGCGVRILGSYPCLLSTEIEAIEKKPIPE